ncbi:MAG: hypothetical protein RIB43_02980 [Rhodospirillaceae bacterium]
MSTVHNTAIRLIFALALAALTLNFMGSAQATEFTVGGAWDVVAEPLVPETFIEESHYSTTDLKATTPLPVSFTTETDILTGTDLTIGYTMPALGTFTVDADDPRSGVTSLGVNSYNRLIDQETYGSYATSFLGGQFGVFGGVTDQHSAFALEQTTSRTVGAAVGYAGFYIRGAYQAAGSDGLIDGRRAWQAGLGYGSGAFDVRVTYVESAFTQGSPTELEGKQWMIGGLVQITPTLLLNANAFYVDREVAMPTVEPPGTGARVGVQLRF